MRDFLDAPMFLRCMNTTCQNAPTANNPITLRALLYDGWTCSICGTVHLAALPGMVQAEPIVTEPLADEPVEVPTVEPETAEEPVEVTKPARPDGLNSMKKAELQDCAMGLELLVFDDMTKAQLKAMIEEETE